MLVNVKQSQFTVFSGNLYKASQEKRKTCNFAIQVRNCGSKKGYNTIEYAEKMRNKYKKIYHTDYRIYECNICGKLHLTTHLNK